MNTYTLDRISYQMGSELAAEKPEKEQISQMNFGIKHSSVFMTSLSRHDRFFS